MDNKVLSAKRIKSFLIKELQGFYINRKKPVFVHILISFGLISFVTYSLLKGEEFRIIFNFFPFIVLFSVLSTFFFFLLSIPLIVSHFYQDKRNFEVYFASNFKIHEIWISKILSIFIFIYPFYILFMFLFYLFCLKFNLTVSFFTSFGIFEFLFVLPLVNILLIGLIGTLQLFVKDIRLFNLFIFIPFALFFIFMRYILNLLNKYRINQIFYTFILILFGIFILLLNIFILVNIKVEKLIKQ